MLSHLDRYHIVLGSQSPRRQELLRGLCLPFEVRSIDVEESYPGTLRGAEIPCFLSQKKAGAYPLADDTLLITADTIVWLGGQVLGKPHGRDEACAMLHALSGRTHEVITGVSITTRRRQRTFAATSQVRFATLDDEEIGFYVDRYRPFDKAGAYGVQEWIGYVGVEWIEGSFYNIMGLPIQRLYAELKAWREE